MHPDMSMWVGREVRYLEIAEAGVYGSPGTTCCRRGSPSSTGIESGAMRDLGESSETSTDRSFGATESHCRLTCPPSQPISRHDALRNRSGVDQSTAPISRSRGVAGIIGAQTRHP